jgi:hypothetical protein
MYNRFFLLHRCTAPESSCGACRKCCGAFNCCEGGAMATWNVEGVWRNSPRLWWRVARDVLARCLQSDLAKRVEKNDTAAAPLPTKNSDPFFPSKSPSLLSWSRWLLFLGQGSGRRWSDRSDGQASRFGVAKTARCGAVLALELPNSWKEPHHRKNNGHASFSAVGWRCSK